LSVLVCTRNRAHKAQRAVASVLANSFADFELIVVDQSTDNATRDAVTAIADERVRYIHTDTVGVAISRNIAIREAAADIVAFTDDDCVCDRGWLKAILAEFAADPQALGVYGRVIPYGRTGSAAWDCVAEDGDMICPALIQSTTRAVVDRPAIPHLVLGGGNNMSFRKKAFERVGLFNEMLGPGSRIGTGEDTEFSYRLLFNRCRLIYSPQPLVEHDNWMERELFVHHMKVAMRVQAAVFAAYALHFDALSVTHLLRTAWYLAGNRLGIGSAATGLFHFATGLPWGVKLRLTPAPQLAPAVAGPPPCPAQATHA
jgi:glycosyltransferase involved in cell wall biosynthesis